MEGRSTVYNKITSEEKIKQINPENAQLSKDFLDYLASIDRSPKTIFAYNSDLEIFFVWNLEENANKLNIHIDSVVSDTEQATAVIFDKTKEFRDIANKIAELSRRNKITLEQKIEIFEIEQYGKIQNKA